MIAHVLTKNVVTVRLIFELLTWRSAAIRFNAGRYIVVEIGEKVAPSVAERTMAFFWGTVKTEKGISEAAGCSLTGSESGTVSGACSDAGNWPDTI